MTLRRSLMIVGVVASVVAVGLLVHRGWKQMQCERLRQACRAARVLGNWVELERLATAWSDLDSRAGDPILYAAEAAVGRQALDRAAEYLGRIPDDDPRAVEALLQRVDMLFGDLARPFAAAETCQRILALAPSCGPAHRRLIFFYAVTLQRTRVAEQARRAIAAGGDIPETYVYLVGSDWLTLSNTTSVTTRWLEHHPDEELFLVAAARGDVATRGLDGSIENAGGSDTQAEAEDGSVRSTSHDQRLRALLERFPTNPELLAYFLQTASTEGDVDEVTSLLARVPAACGDDNRFWRFKGWMHAARGEAEEAQDAYGRALELNAFDFGSRHQLAEVLRTLGRTDAAAPEAALAAEGRALRRAILEQPDIASVPPAVLARVQRFIRGSGEDQVADRLSARMGDAAPTHPGVRAGPDGRLERRLLSLLTESRPATWHTVNLTAHIVDGEIWVRDAGMAGAACVWGLPVVTSDRAP